MTASIPPGMMPAAGEPVAMQAILTVTRLNHDADPGSLLGLLAKLENPCVLDSSAYHPEHGRYTLFACSPLWVLELADAVLRDGRGVAVAAEAEGIWAALERAFTCVTVREKHPAPFSPGWIGYFGYELGRLIEVLPCRVPRDTSLPDMRLAFFDALLVYDAATRAWSLAELVFDETPAGAGRAAERLLDLLRAGGRDAFPPLADPAERRLSLPAASNFLPGDYRAAVGRCVDYIAAGDIFQVNLSQRFTIRPSPSPTAIYRILRSRNPAWYSALLHFQSGGEDCAVLSSSPELFLRVRESSVITCPIKGTRPRIGSRRADREASRSLLSSEKDNAELAMIIDLLRNDLGRVCRFGSVRVTDRRRLETHPTVFHLVGTVAGELRDGVGMAELLRSTFPGGSITGAPKIRAMEIIDELEPAARGVYTGCIGIVGADGSACLNIAIRTIICDGDRALVQAGGGIVADSAPEEEYRETLDKARALLESIDIASRGPYTH